MTRIYNPFIPVKDADLAIWADNFDKKIEQAGTQLGLSAVEVAQLKEDARSLIDLVNAVEGKKRELEHAVTAKDDGKTLKLKSLRASIAHLKTLPGYTEAIGGELGIVGGSYVVENSAIKPLLRAHVENGVVKLQFKKMRQPGVNIYCRLQGTSVFEKLAYDYASPYIDGRSAAVAGHAEVREYKVVCSDGKLEIGRDSDIVSVLFGG